jgi:hypothetical protein
VAVVVVSEVSLRANRGRERQKEREREAVPQSVLILKAQQVGGRHFFQTDFGLRLIRLLVVVLSRMRSSISRAVFEEKNSEKTTQIEDQLKKQKQKQKQTKTKQKQTKKKKKKQKQEGGGYLSIHC